MTNDSAAILERCGAFYENLCTEHEDLLAPLDTVAEEIESLERPQLSQQDSAIMDSLITEDECKMLQNIKHLRLSDTGFQDMWITM